MEQILAFTENLKNRYQEFTAGQKGAVWALVTIGISSLIAMSFWVQEPDFQLLYSNLSAEDAAAIVDDLKTQKIPYELEEAAFVDGASRLYTLRRVILPLAVPGLIVVGVAMFIGAYAQQFLFAITFNQNRDYMPLPAGIFEFVGYQTVLWNEMMAASLIGILPVLLIFLFMQKHLISGLTSGAVKE